MAYDWDSNANERAAAYKEDADRKRVRFFTPPEGTSQIRFLPPWNPKILRFWFETTIHWGAMKGSKIPCLCGRALDPAEDCFFCEEAAQLEVVEKKKLLDQDSNKDPWIKTAAKNVWIFNILDLSEVGVGPKVMTQGWQAWRCLQKFLNMDKYGDIISPTKGRNVTLTYDSKANPRIDMEVDMQTTSLEDIGSSIEILDDLRDLSQHVEYRSYAQQKKTSANSSGPVEVGGGNATPPPQTYSEPASTPDITATPAVSPPALKETPDDIPFDPEAGIDSERGGMTGDESSEMEALIGRASNILDE